MDSWEGHFRAQSALLSSRIRRRIFNLDLLRRSKEESEFDRMQRDARQGLSMGLDPMLDSDEGEDEDDTPLLTPLVRAVDDALELGDDAMDFYTHEAIDACHESGFFEAPMHDIVPDSFSFLSKAIVASAFKSLDARDGLAPDSSHDGPFPPSRRRSPSQTSMERDTQPCR